MGSGLAANLLSMDVRNLLRPGGEFGPLLEGFSWANERADLYRYRAKDGIEVEILPFGQRLGAMPVSALWEIAAS